MAAARLRVGTRFMRVSLFFLPFLLLAVAAHGEKPFEPTTGKSFDRAVPKDFYLEGNAIPTAKRNAVLVHTTGGGRALFALIDTSGYATDVIARYAGMIITEGDLTVCGIKLTTGSYGFGWARPGNDGEGPGSLLLYDQAGKKLGECVTQRDPGLKQPRPLQVIPTDGGGKLYYGRQFAELR